MDTERNKDRHVVVRVSPAHFVVLDESVISLPILCGDCVCKLEDFADPANRAARLKVLTEGVIRSRCREQCLRPYDMVACLAPIAVLEEDGLSRTEARAKTVTARGRLNACLCRECCPPVKGLAGKFTT